MTESCCGAVAIESGAVRRKKVSNSWWTKYCVTSSRYTIYLSMYDVRSISLVQWSKDIKPSHVQLGTLEMRNEHVHCIGVGPEGHEAGLHRDRGEPLGGRGQPVVRGVAWARTQRSIRTWGNSAARHQHHEICPDTAPAVVLATLASWSWQCSLTSAWTLKGHHR